MNTIQPRRARVAGLGLVSAAGDCVDDHIDALLVGKSTFARSALTQFSEPHFVPYLRLADSVERPHFFSPVLVVAEQALADSGLSPAERCRLPLFIGSSSYAIGASEQHYADALQVDAAGAIPVPSAGFSQLSRFLQDECGLKGADYLFNTACTASANALLMATDAIVAGTCERALVIGCELFNVTTAAGFHGMQLLTDTAMRPFDRRRNGLVLGEGCAAILLEACNANDDGALIAGGASSCDTFSISTSNPDGSTIAAVMREALTNARIGPNDVVAIKAHGTASPLNDDAEAAGIRQVFDKLPPIAAIKALTGHTLGGCGAVETSLMIGALRNNALPASAGFEAYDEDLDVRPLTRSQSAGPGFYMLNFFGFGGNNASIVIEHRP